ncbi:MAG TPA: histidine phosphatase family protein [Miltoncostaeaceae bacterium]|nr:histidine phosphatase family protein [Miltoncostaeaceae bacterium]
MADPPPPLVPHVERRLYLVRHAETDALTADGFMHCADPIPLTPRGVGQAKALGRLFADVPATRVHASPMDRTAHTARILAGARRPVAVDPRLREISLGDLDGAHTSEVFAAAPRWLADPDAALPGGESLNAVVARAGAALTDILEASDDHHVVVVAHGGVNRGLIAHLLGMRMDRAYRIRQDWACVNVLDRSEGRWWIGVLNWTPAGVDELAMARGALIGGAAMRRLGR